MDETFGLPAFVWKIAQGGDVLFSIVIIVGVLAEIVLMVWAFKAIGKAIRKRREERQERELGELRARTSRQRL